MTWVAMFILLIAFVANGVGFFFWGHREGVKETEERWSYAVNRAALERKEGRA